MVVRRNVKILDMNQISGQKKHFLNILVFAHKFFVGFRLKILFFLWTFDDTNGYKISFLL